MEKKVSRTLSFLCIDVGVFISNVAGRMRERKMATVVVGSDAGRMKEKKVAIVVVGSEGGREGGGEWVVMMVVHTSRH